LIPAKVIGHAVRSLEIRDILRKKDLPKPLETDDKFLNRLNYCVNIHKMFRDQNKCKVKPVTRDCPPYFVFDKKALKKAGLSAKDLDITTCDKSFLIQKTSKEVWRKTKRLPVWEIAHKVIANTFYLGYLDNYRDRARLYRHLFSLTRGSIGAAVKLRTYCMSQRSLWIDNRLFGPVCQDKVIQTKANFPSGKKV
jgi:hypothetical protein